MAHGNFGWGKRLLPKGEGLELFYRATLAGLDDFRHETKTPWNLLDTLWRAQHRRGSITMRTLFESALTMGLYLDTREDFLRYAHRVAEKLPTADDIEAMP